MRTLYGDTETYGALDLKRTGAYRYAEIAELLLYPYALDDGPVYLWDAATCELLQCDPLPDGDVAFVRLATAEAMPEALHDALHDDGVRLTFHNAAFDRQILAHVLGIRPRLERFDCTMVKALSHAYPGKLESLGPILGLPMDKAKVSDGKKLINRFCKPAPSNHKADRYTHETHPAEWHRFRVYAVRDVIAMREVDRRLPAWNWQPRDLALWHLSERINDRGMQIDRELCAAGAVAAVAEKDRLRAEFVTLTNAHPIEPTPTAPSQRDKFRAYLNARFGLALADTKKETFQPLLDGDTLAPECRRLMDIALLNNKTSTSKYAALHPALAADDRFRGGLQFRGAARTRRFAGRLFQPQNLPSRGLPRQEWIDQYIVALRHNIHDMLFDDLMLYGAAAIRALVVAKVGTRLAVADLSNIEGRIVAYLADETWKLEAFRDFDAGLGPDLYMLTATSIVGGDPWDKGATIPGRRDKIRDVFGKVPDLFGAYQGGFGAAQTFARGAGLRTPDGRAMSNYMDTIMANADPELVSSARANWTRWGADREPDADPEEWLACEVVKLAWRRRHPATVELWARLQEAAVRAIQNPGTAYKAGRWLTFAVRRHAGISYLLCKLPSGAVLCYCDPRVSLDDNVALASDTDAALAPHERKQRRRAAALAETDVRNLTLTYMGIKSDVTGGDFGPWTRVYLYGGKLLENCAQSMALDVMMHNMPAIEAAGYGIVLSVHDELLAETVDGSGEDMAAIMARVPPWCSGLPLAAEGFTTDVYRK